MKNISKTLKNNKGFTLVELMITLAILLIILTLCFQTFNYIYKSYDKSEEDWIIQQDVRKITDWIDRNIQTAYVLDIYAAKPVSFSETDTFYYLYVENKSVYLRSPTKITGTLLAGETIDVNYSFDEVNKPNALHYIITGNDLKTKTQKVYSVDGTVLILNITAGKKINYYTPIGTVNKDGTCIKFKTTADGIKGMIDIK
jgi:prepilin-type N-terminal cleavage/methylation domain-containing protein